jgi:ribosomal protein L34E
MKCKKCGWELEYIPRSFREQIKEIIEERDRKGYYTKSKKRDTIHMCPECLTHLKFKK